MTRMLLCAIAIWSGILAAPALAAPLDPALQAELIKLYEAFNAAVKKGDYKAAMAVRDSDTRRNIEAQVKTEKQRKDFIAQNRAVLPAKVDVKEGELLENGTAAQVQTVATLIAPPRVRGKNGVPKDGRVEQPITLEFKREGGAWRYVGPIFMAAPAKVKACDENQPETEQAFAGGHDLSIGGLIKRVKFADTYTAIVVDVVGEENCLYLPDRSILQRAGLNTDLLEPRALLEAEGIRHPKDGQKAWLTGLKVTQR